MAPSSPALGPPKDPRTRSSTPKEIPTGPRRHSHSRPTSKERMPPPPLPLSVASSSNSVQIPFVPAVHSANPPIAQAAVPLVQPESGQANHPENIPMALPSASLGLKELLKSGDPTKGTLDPKWRDKVKEISGTISILDKRRDLQAQMQLYERLRANPNNNPEDNAVLDKALKSVQGEDTLQEIRFTESETKLREVSALPELPEVVKRRLDILGHVTSLQKTADHLLSTLKKVQGVQDTPAADTMHVDKPMEDNLKVPADLASCDGPTVDPETMNRIENDVLELDRRFDAITEQAMQMQDVSEETMADQAQDILQQYLADRSNATEIEQIPDRLETLDQKADTLNAELNTLFVEANGLATSEQGLTQNYHNAFKWKKEAQEDIQALNQRVDELSQKKSDTAQRIAALEAALDAYIAAPVMPATTMSPAYIMEALEAPIQEAVEQTIEAGFENLRVGTQQMVREETERIYQHVWKKTQLLRQVSKLIIARIEEERQKGNEAV